MLSHVKYQKIAAGFTEYVSDPDTLEKLLGVIKAVTNYSEDTKTYNRTYYENTKAKRKASGQSSWTDYRKRYYEQHKEEINKKRYELQKKARQPVKEGET